MPDPAALPAPVLLQPHAQGCAWSVLAPASPVPTRRVSSPCSVPTVDVAAALAHISGVGCTAGTHPSGAPAGWVRTSSVPDVTQTHSASSALGGRTLTTTCTSPAVGPQTSGPCLSRRRAPARSPGPAAEPPPLQRPCWQQSGLARGSRRPRLQGPRTGPPGPCAAGSVLSARGLLREAGLELWPTWAAAPRAAAR